MNTPVEPLHAGSGPRARESASSAPPAALRVVPVVAVGGGKGGVGVSTIAALLAATMAEQGHQVLLVDAGQGMAGLHHLLGVEPRGSLGQLRGEREPRQLLVPVAERLSLFPATAEDLELKPTERRILLRRVTALHPEFDLVVIDAGATAESLAAVCVDGARRLLAVTAGDRIALAATYAVIKLLHERTPSVRVDVVANRVDDESADRLFTHLNGASVRFLSRTTPFAGTVPDDPGFAEALAAGLGTAEASLGSTAALAVREIGERLMTDSALPTAPPHRLLRKG